MPPTTTALDRGRRSGARRPCSSFAATAALAAAIAMAGCARARAQAALDPSLRCVNDNSWLGVRTLAEDGRVASMSCSKLLDVVFACVNRPPLQLMLPRMRARGRIAGRCRLP